MKQWRFLENLLWVIARETQVVLVPSWTGSNVTPRKSMTTSKYVDTVNAPATDMSTVSEILKQSPATWDWGCHGPIIVC